MSAMVRTGVAVLWSAICCTLGLVALYIRRDASGWVLHRIGGVLWSRNLLKWVGTAPLEIQGPEDVPASEWWPERAIYIANHTSQLDINAVFAAIPHPVVFLAKQAIRNVPLLGAVNARAGTVFVERGNPDSAARAAQALRRTLDTGKVVFVFPEGTRSADGLLLPFKSGAFHLAVQAGVPVVPMYIHGTHAMLSKGRFGIRRGRVVVRVGKPLDADGTESDSVTRLTQAGREAVAALGATF
jgi:1-acyl-sn-glycerol-3-phosphate acyltransferase